MSQMTLHVLFCLFFFPIHCEFTPLDIFLLACCWKMWLLGWRTGNWSAKGNWANGGLWEWGSLHSSISTSLCGMTVMECKLCVCLAELLVHVQYISVYVCVCEGVCIVFVQMLTVYSSWNHFTHEWWECTLILILGLYHDWLLCIQHTGLTWWGARMPLIAFQTVHSVS